MRQRTLSKVGGALLALCSIPVSSYAATVDLSSWTVQNWSSGAGAWAVESSGQSVLQTVNGNPTVFLSDQSAIGTDIRGRIKVESGGAWDNDYVGFVLGFDDGDFGDASADYLLVDWKQGNQDVAKRGLAVSRVNGVTSVANDFWQHSGTVQELARGINLGDTGWIENVEYNFRFVFTASALQVYVNDALEIDITGSFSGGNLGFYNYSQSHVRYSGFTQDVLPPTGVPEAGSTLLLLGLAAGSLGMFARRNR